MRYSMCIATSPWCKAPLGTKLNTDQQCANKLIQTSQMQFLLEIHYHRVGRLGTNLDHHVLRAILYLEGRLIFTKRVIFIRNLRMISVYIVQFSFRCNCANPSRFHRLSSVSSMAPWQLHVYTMPICIDQRMPHPLIKF